MICCSAKGPSAFENFSILPLFISLRIPTSVLINMDVFPNISNSTFSIKSYVFFYTYIIPLYFKLYFADKFFEASPQFVSLSG